MAKYLVNHRGLRDQGPEMQRVGEALSPYQNQLRNLANKLDNESNLNGLKQYLLQYSDYIPVFAGRFKVMGNVLTEAARIYSMVEDLDAPVPSAGITGYVPNACGLLGTPEFGSMLDAALNGHVSVGDLLAYGHTLGVPAASLLTLLYGGGTDSPFDTYSFEYGRYDDDGHVQFEGYKQIEKTFWERGGDTEWAKEFATIYGVSASVGVSGYLLPSAGASGDVGWARGSAEAGIANYEAYAGVSAGLYVYDRDGKKMLAPSVNAVAGASFSLLTASASGSIGLGDNHELLGLGGSGSASVGKVAAEARASFSLLSENGGLSPQLKLSGKAEALAFEANFKAGVTVLGAGVGVTGSFKVGVGVSANVGFTDGVFKFEVGAALGIGFSIGFDINVGGIVNAVCGAVQSAVTAVAKTTVTVVNAVVDTAKAVGNAVVSTAKKVGNFFKKLFG